MLDEELTAAFVVTAEWRAKPGADERVAEICEELVLATRREPGNRFFQTLRSSADPRLFYLYEEYVDEAAYETHRASEHFVRLVQREAMPALLEADDRESFEASARLINLSPATPHGPRLSPGRRTGRHAGSALRAFVDRAHAGDRVIGTAVLLDLTPVAARAAIDIEALEHAADGLRTRGEDIRPGDILLLRSDWTARTTGNPNWFRHSPWLTRDAAAWLTTQHPSCVGCDFFEPDAPVQRQILEAGVALVDGLVNLALLPDRCEFFAPYYDVAAVGTAPARAFAWAWEAA